MFATMTMSPEHPDLAGDMISMDDMNVSQNQVGKFSHTLHQGCFVVGHGNVGQSHGTQHPLPSLMQSLSQRLKPLIRQRLMIDRSPQPVQKAAEISSTCNTQSEVTCFASHGSFGVVDLGASQSVIGQRQLEQVLDSLGSEIRKLVIETKCDTIFRFGNSSTVHCQKAMLIPLGRWYVKLCIVPSDTPFFFVQ